MRPLKASRHGRIAIGRVKDPDLVEKKQHHIVQAAYELFRKKGYHPTTTDEIASACNMSKGQLYNYISTKDDILFLIYNHLNDLWLDRIASSNFEREDNPKKKLRLALQITTRFNVEYKDLIRLVYREAKYMKEEYRNEFNALYKKNVTAIWRNLLQEIDGQDAVIGGVNAAAQAVTAFVLSFALSWGRPTDKRKFDQYVDYSIDFILRGLGISEIS
jgi:AcrR family transcriptional regulator